MLDPMITPQTTVCRVDAVLASTLGDDTVLLNIDKGAYHGLNMTGSQIWTLLTQPMAVSEVCDRVAADFSISPHQCDQDVILFIQDLVARGLVQVIPAVKT